MSYSLQAGIGMLSGAHIERVTLHEGVLFFVTDRGCFRGSPEGDCCANCYIQHVSGSEALTDAVVTEVEHITLPDVEDPNDVSDVWGHKLRTTKGHASIEMRVDHNGYYGGSLEFYRCEPDEVRGNALEDF